MRIESVRFDASGNAAIALSGGISFFLPKARIGEFAAMAASAWDLPFPSSGEPGGGPGAGMGGGSARGFLSALPTAAPEFEEDDEACRFLAQADEAARATQKALELCARAEQSSAGLSAKLAQRGFSRKAAGEALRTLAERGIVDDGRYAALWARQRAERKGEGPATIAAELRARGFRSEAIAAALAEIDFGPALEKAVRRESAKLAALLRKRGRGEAGELGKNFRDSLRANLRKQGFDPELIGDEIEKLK